MLRHPRLPLFAALLAMLLTLSSLGSGWQLDDYFHRAALLDSASREIAVYDRAVASEGGISGMFRFLKGDPQQNHHLIELLMPWWTYPHLRLALFRPLTAVTHWLDYHLWPNSAPLMHLQSLLWLAMLVLAVGAFYRRFLGGVPAAGLATLFYAVDDAHALPACWLANRNALVAAVFGVLAILAYDRARRTDWKPGNLIGPFWFACGLLSGEAGVAALAYLVAHAVCLDNRAWPSRLRALAPYLFLLVVWRVAWNRMGFGTIGSGFYVDPGAQPLRYLTAVGQRAPILLMGQWLPVPSDLTMFVSPAVYQKWLGIAVVVMAVLALLFSPLIARDRVACFFTLGMLLSVLPVCATFPSDRLLVFVGIGAFGLLSQFLTAFFKNNEADGPRLSQTRAGRIGIGVAVAALIVTHGVIAPVILSKYTTSQANINRQLYLPMPRDPAASQQSFVIVNGPSSIHAFYLPVLCVVQHLPPPRRMRVLFSSMDAMQITRVDAQTLRLRPEHGYCLAPVDVLFRASDLPMHIGDRIELSDMTITVTALTSNHRAQEIECRFHVPLEDASLHWLWWQNGSYQPFALPPVGARVDIPAVHVAL